METKTILLVEDESVTAAFLTNTLKNEGYTVINASTGEMALQIVYADGSMIDIILMDIELDSRMNGIEAAKEILKLFDLPILILSSHSEKEIVGKTDEISTYGYVHKNSGSYVLLASINMTLKLHEANINLKKWKNAIEHAEWGVMVCSPDGENLDIMNPCFAKMHGYSVEEMKGMNLKSIFAQESRNELGKNIKIANENGHHTFESIHYKKDGSQFPALLDITITKDKSGNTVNRIINVKDISHRKQAEKKIRLSEKRAQDILNTIPDLMFRINSHGIFLDYKADIKDLYVQSGTSFIGKNICEILPHEFSELVLYYIRLTQETGQLQTFGYQMSIPGTGMRDYEARMIASGDDEVIAIVRDITEKKELEKEITNISENERRAIGSNLHDDLGQKLSYLGFLTEMMKQEVQKGAPVDIKDLDEMIYLISNSIDHVRNISKGLHPVNFETGGFIFAIEELGAEVKKYFNTDLIIDKDFDVNITDETVSSNLYYIIKEAINNSIKHEKAEKINLVFNHDGKNLHILLFNNKKNSKQSSKDGMGLKIMKYRADLIGALLRISEEKDIFKIEINLKI